MKRRKPHAWSGKWSLTHRILAVNILTVIIVALGIVYLDAFRNRLSKERLRRAEREAQISSVALANAPAERRPEAMAAIGRATDSRIRLYDAGGRLVADSWSITGPPTDFATRRRSDGRRISRERSTAASTRWSAPTRSAISPSPRSTASTPGRKRSRPDGQAASRGSCARRPT